MKRIFKWLGILVGLVLMLAIAFAVFVYFSSNAKINKTYEVEAALLSVRADSAILARGAHLALIHGCTECHGENLEGRVLFDAPPFARVTAANLTPGAGGIGSEYTNEDWDRAIRHGIAVDGSGLMPMMPSKAYSNLHNQDAADLIAYLRQLEPVDNDLPETTLYPIGRMALATGGLTYIADEIDHSKAPPPVLEPAPTAEYGNYMTNITCTDCHGSDLRGGPHPDPDAPEGPDLTSVASWPFEDFATAMRTGVRPNGLVMDAKFMPWRSFQHMTSTELTAVYTYLKGLSPTTDPSG
jgi:cytochrome c553